MKKLNPYLHGLICVLISALTVSVNSQVQPDWKKLTDFRGINAINDLSTGKDGIVYTATADQNIYYSTDGGESWTAFSNVARAFNHRRVVASPTTDRVFLPTSTQGIRFTDDFGDSWSTRKIGGVNSVSGFTAPVGALAVNGNTVAAGIGTTVNGSLTTKVFLSHNNGETFAESGHTPVMSEGFHYYRDSLLFSVSESGLYVTDDVQSGNWQLNSFNGQLVSDMAVGSDRIYVSIISFSGAVEVYQSDDHGNSWSQLPEFTDNTFINEMIYLEGEDELYTIGYGGLHVFKNGGWTQIDEEQYAYNLAATGDNSLLYGGYRVRGVKKMTHGSNEITTHEEGLALPPHNSTITHDDQLYYGSYFTSLLTRIDLNTLETEVYNLFDHLLHTRIISTVTDTNGDCIVGGTHYIARIKDKGEDIEIIADSNSAPTAPVYNELFPYQLYAGNNGSIAMVQHATQVYLDYSPDGGQTWEVTYDESHPDHPGLFNIEDVQIGTAHVFIMGMSTQTAQNAILMSKDEGQSWETLPKPGQHEIIQKIYIDNKNTLFTVTSNGVYSWDSDEEEWEQIDVYLGNNSNRDVEIRFDRQNNPMILVRATGTPFPEEGIYMLDENDEFEQILFPEANGDKIRLTKLTFNSDGIPVAITTAQGNFDDANNGVYYYSDITLSSPDDERVKKSISVYPNPASSRVSLSEPITTAAQLISINGKVSEVKIENGQFNVSDIPRGMYILRFQHNERTETVKLIVSE